MEKSFVEAFNQKLKTKPFEHFSLMLFDLNELDPTKTILIEKILFLDHKSPHYWLDYVNHLKGKLPGKRMQLQRLINKAIESIDEEKYRMDRHLLQLFIVSARNQRFAPF
jgi:hypothetical protein